MLRAPPGIKIDIPVVNVNRRQLENISPRNLRVSEYREKNISLESIKLYIYSHNIYENVSTLNVY